MSASDAQRANRAYAAELRRIEAGGEIPDLLAGMLHNVVEPDTLAPMSNAATIEDLRLGVANLTARVADAQARAEADPSFGPGWVALDRAQWALADMRTQLADAERTV